MRPRDTIPARHRVGPKPSAMVTAAYARNTIVGLMATVDDVADGPGRGGAAASQGAAGDSLEWGETGLET